MTSGSLLIVAIAENRVELIKILKSLPNLLYTKFTCDFGELVHTGWQKCRGYHIVVGHFLQKSHIISGSFAERDQRVKAFYASSPLCGKAPYADGSNSQKSACYSIYNIR